MTLWGTDQPVSATAAAAPSPLPLASTSSVPSSTSHVSLASDKFAIAEAERLGKPVFALCRPAEAGADYWVCYVLEYIPDAKDGKWMMKLARMEEIEDTDPRAAKQSEWAQAVLYLCSQSALLETFWEHEDHLLPVQLVPADTTTWGHPTTTKYRLTSNVEELLASAKQSPTDSDDMAAVSLRDLTLITLDPDDFFEVLVHKNPDDVDGPIDHQPARTPAEITVRCDNLISGLMRQVNMVDDVTQEVWKRLRVSDNIEVFCKQTKTNTFHCYMARAVVNASPSEIKHILRHSQNREEFDPMCRGTSLVQLIDDSTHILHFVDQKFMINREFCVIRHDRTMADGNVYLVSNSVRTNRCPEGEYIRSQVIHSGYSLMSRGKGSCLMTYITQVNLTGWLPSVLVDYVMDVQVHGVIHRIRTYFELKERYESKMRRGSIVDPTSPRPTPLPRPDNQPA